MKKLVLFVGLCAVISYHARSQEMVFDPALSGVLMFNNVMENNSMADIKEKQNMIQNLQTATVATVNFINEWQKKTYEGLLYISNNVKNVFQLYECYKVLQSIYESETAMLREARKNPLALAFATKIQAEMITRAIGYYGQIKALILKEGDKNLLMNAGERIRLMNEILMNLKVIDALAYSSYLRVRMVVQQGIIKSLNPFASIVNRDAQLVKDVLNKWKF